MDPYSIPIYLLCIPIHSWLWFDVDVADKTKEDDNDDITHYVRIYV